MSSASLGTAVASGTCRRSTIHKAQGSEYPAVILPLATQHYAMLQRNLLYTGPHAGQAARGDRGTKKGGRHCRDAFLGLKKTCAKHTVRFWDYLGHRRRPRHSSMSPSSPFRSSIGWGGQPGMCRSTGITADTGPTQA